MHSTWNAFLSHDQDMLAYCTYLQLVTGVKSQVFQWVLVSHFLNFKHISYMLMIAYVFDFHVMLTWPVVGRGSKCTVRQFIVPRPP